MNGVVIASFAGNQLPTIEADGNQQSSLSNRYVNFFLGSDFYNEVVLSTTSYAFEMDNVAFADPPAPVPEPNSGVMFATLLLAGSIIWRLRAANRPAKSPIKNKFRF
jgi:hypothetical protein